MTDLWPPISKADIDSKTFLAQRYANCLIASSDKDGRFSEWEVAKMIFALKMDLLKAVIRSGQVIVPGRFKLTMTMEADTLSDEILKYTNGKVPNMPDGEHTIRVETFVHF